MEPTSQNSSHACSLHANGIEIGTAQTPLPDQDLTLLNPGLNEEERLLWTLNELQRSLLDWGIDHRALVADDGSSDRPPTLTDLLGPRFSPASPARHRIERALRECELEQLLSEDIASARRRERAAFDEAVAPFQQRLVLFGAGNLGRKAVRALRRHGIEPLALADNSPALWGKEIEGVRVLAPEDAARRFGASAAFVITVFSPACDVVPFQRQLSALGCAKVVPFMTLLWKYAEDCLPHVMIDLPHRVLEGRESVRQGLQLFGDDASRREYVAQVRWRLWADFAALPQPSAYDQYFPEDLFALRPDEVFVDGGAYDGDTIRSLLKGRTDFRQIIALEPDPHSFQRLEECLAGMAEPFRRKISAYQVAVAAAKGTIRFGADGTPGAKIAQQGGIEVPCDALDDLLAGETPSYVKLDVEGAELDALRGARGILSRGKSIWAVCVYHQLDDLWQLPLMLRATLPADYRLFLRKHGGEIFDTVCYAVPAMRLASPAAACNEVHGGENDS